MSVLVVYLHVILFCIVIYLICWGEKIPLIHKILKVKPFSALSVFSYTDWWIDWSVLSLSLSVGVLINGPGQHLQTWSWWGESWNRTTGVCLSICVLGFYFFLFHCFMFFFLSRSWINLCFLFSPPSWVPSLSATWWRAPWVQRGWWVI